MKPLGQQYKGATKRNGIGMVLALGALLTFSACGTENDEGRLFADGLPEIGQDEGALCTGITVTRDVPSPTSASTPVTFTVGSTCAEGQSAEYRFLVRKVDTSVVYTQMQAYSASNTWIWDTTNTSRGTYYVMVQARAVGSGANLESWVTAHHEITSIEGANCSQSPALSYTSGTSPGVLKVTGSVSCTLGGEANYLFWVKPNGTNDWSEIRAWGRAGTFDYNTVGMTPGIYVVLMFARDEVLTGSSYEASKTMQITVTGGLECQDVQLNRVTPTPQFQNAVVQLNADTTCFGSTVPEVQYYLKLQGQTTYTMLRDWGPTAYTWNTTGLAAGTHIIMVVVRGVGRDVAYDDWQTGYFQLVDPNTLSAGQGSLWLGLSNSSGNGSIFDVLVEVLNSSNTVVASGTLENLAPTTTQVLRTIPLTIPSGTVLTNGQTFSTRVRVRIDPSSPVNNATLRLEYDATTRNSGLSLTDGGGPDFYYFHTATAMDLTNNTGDTNVNQLSASATKTGGSPWVTMSTWTGTR